MIPTEEDKQEISRVHGIWKKKKKDSFFKKIIRKLAWYAGYTCVPRDYKLWLSKSATHHTTCQLVYKHNLYEEGQQSGMARAYNIVSLEITEFERDQI